MQLARNSIAFFSSVVFLRFSPVPRCGAAGRTLDDLGVSHSAARRFKVT